MDCARVRRAGCASLRPNTVASTMRTYSKDRVQHYVLERADPICAPALGIGSRRTFVRVLLPPARRVLALLSGYVGEFVGRREIDYVLPEPESPGRGLARSTSGESDDAITELSHRGYAISETAEGLWLDRSAKRRARAADRCHQMLSDSRPEACGHARRDGVADLPSDRRHGLRRGNTNESSKVMHRAASRTVMGRSSSGWR